jgi:large subunit ribosomal protein L28
LYSELLDSHFSLKVTTSVIRTIDKKGGLDKYLLETRDKNLFSEKAVNMKRDLQEVLKSTKSVEKQL